MPGARITRFSGECLPDSTFPAHMSRLGEHIAPVARYGVVNAFDRTWGERKCASALFLRFVWPGMTDFLPRLTLPICPRGPRRYALVANGSPCLVQVLAHLLPSLAFSLARPSPFSSLSPPFLLPLPLQPIQIHRIGPFLTGQAAFQYICRRDPFESTGIHWFGQLCKEIWVTKPPPS